MLLIFTGNGKGKTSSAIGIALRAWGQGKRVLFVSFLKGNFVAGEFKAIRRLNDPFFKVCSFGRECPYRGVDCCPGEQECIIHSDNISDRDRENVHQGLDMVSREMAVGNWDLIVLDEIVNVFNLFTACQKAILKLVDEREQGMDWILTGRNCSPELALRADLISEMVAIRHPFQDGLKAKRGIDY